MKYADTKVVFEEVPDEITLAINITNCKIKCRGCHSKHLWKDTGIELTGEELKRLIDENKGITCVAIMGGDFDTEAVKKALMLIKSLGLKTCWYSGIYREYERNVVLNWLPYLDYLKTGPYVDILGGLDKPDTNQHFYEIIPVNKDSEYVYYKLNEITYKFKTDVQTSNKSQSTH